MVDSANLPDPRTADDALKHLDHTIEDAKRAARAALDANEPPGAERIPEQADYTPTEGGDFPAGMSQTLGRAAERMRDAQHTRRPEAERDELDQDELGERP